MVKPSPKFRPEKSYDRATVSDLSPLPMKPLSPTIIALALGLVNAFGFQLDEYNPSQLAVDHAVKALNSYAAKHSIKVSFDEDKIHVRVWQDFPGRGANQGSSTKVRPLNPAFHKPLLGYRLRF
jgi:ribosome maturation protein Sdo1